MNTTNRTKNASRNIVFGLFSQIVNILLPFAVRTILIYRLGMDYAGLSSLLSSILQVLSLSELGFGSAMVYSMYRPVADGDTERLCALLNYYKKIYRVVGLSMLSIGFALMPFLPYLVKGTYPPDINLYVLYAIYLVNSAISYFLFAYKQSLLVAYQRADINSNISTLCYVLLYFAQILSLIFIRNYYAYLILLPVSTALNNLLTNLFAKKRFSEIECRGNISRSDRKKIKKDVAALAGNRFSDVLTSSFDNIVISAFLGISVLSVYANYYYIESAVFCVLSIIDNAILAVIGNSIATESVDKNYADFKKFTFLYVWMVGWCAICLLCLYQPFITIWVGQKNLLPFSTVFVLAINFYIWKFRGVLATYKNAAGLWWQDKFRPYYSSILNLALNIFLVQHIGVNGVLLSTILVMLSINMPVPTHVVFKYYFKRGSREYYLRLLCYTLVVFFAGWVTYLCCGLFSSKGILWLVVKFVLCVIVPNFTFLIFAHFEPDYKHAKDFILKVVALWK